uniref:Uncharacterized protein n=1 Tax=Rhodosorus marinus TaxID=101924 RepID=A0A7S3E6Y7_9RHOD|mmetsp:Transcript_10564/g.44047  ORF Transcript_10564/g.44047 Transcript_10564/m.44047 type:complete len:394 (+) Transcript_10564:40-1221(+)
MESVGFVLAGGVRLSQGKVRESLSSRRKGQVYNGGGRRVWVFAQVASTGEMGEAVSEKRAQEILEKRIAESKARVDFLSSRVIVRDAESCVAEAEGVMAVEYEQFFADSEEGKQELSENRDKFMQELSEALEKLQRCLKELRLIETQHENAVDASETIARIYQSVEVLSAISQRLTDAPVPEKSDSSSRLAVDEIREEVRQRVVRVGQGLEKRVGQFVREDGSIDFPEITSAARVTVTKSSEIWARLNGVTPEGASLQQAFEESPVMWELRSTIEQLEKKLDDASRKREKRLRKEDQLGKLIKARELREMDDSVNTVRRMLAVTVLQLELERIYLYLRNEVETTSDFMDQQLLIREFGQMDERLSILKVWRCQPQATALTAYAAKRLGRLARR